MKYEIVPNSLPNIPIRLENFSKPSPIRPVSDPHLHDEVELLYVHQGAMSCTADKQYIIPAGGIMFLNSRIPHSTDVVENGTVSALVQFRVDAFSGDTNPVRKSLAQFISAGGCGSYLFGTGETELQTCITGIMNEYTHKGEAYEIYIRGFIYQIMGFLYRKGILASTEQMFNLRLIERVFPALEYIDHHYSEPITLEQISAHLSLNPNYFCRLFKRATNRTFTEYLNFVRILKCEPLLREKSRSIEEISQETGFSSASYFNRTFKKYKHCTPTVYRKLKND